MKPKALLQLNSFFTLCLETGLIVFFFTCSQLNLLAQADKLIFQDDFNRSDLGTNWQASKSWSIMDGAAYNGSDYGALFTTRNFSSDSYIIETAVKGFSNAYWRQFLFTFGQAGSASQESPTYVLKYSPFRGNYLALSRATDNIFYPDTLLDKVIIYPELETTRWYKFKIAKYKSGLIQVYLDEGAGYGSVPLLETIDSAYQQLGHLGWSIDSETVPEDFFMDWIEVRTPLVEKPAIREKPPEDNLISLAVTNSGKTYEISKLKMGVQPYADRNYTITAVPSYLQGASFVRTNMADKYNTEEPFLNLFFNKRVIVYVAYDPRASTRPAWLQDWYKTNDVIRTNDPGTDYLEVYSKSPIFYFVPFELGGNLASPAAGARSNYLVIAVEEPTVQTLEAEEAKVVGAAIAQNHPGYSGTGFVDFINSSHDYIEWNIQTEVPGTYFLTFTFANGGATERLLFITADGLSVDTVSFEPLNSWDTWEKYHGPEIYLTRGTHKIRATAIGTSGPNLDYISLTYYSNSRPETETASSQYVRKALTTSEHAYSIAKLSAVAYPNPFENKATIAYSLPEQAAVYLAVYNQQGQKVKVLVDKVQLAGYYTLSLNGQNLPKGLYLYRLKAGTQVISGKIVRQLD